MTTRTFESLVARLSPSVPGCPRQTAVQYIRDSAIRTCERTLAWRYTQPRFELLPGVHEYSYNKPADTRVHVLFDAMVNDRPLQKLTLEDALFLFPDWADLYSGEDPSVLWSETPPGTYDETQYNEDLFNEGETFVLPDAVVAKASEPRAVTQLTPDKYIVLPLPDGDRTYNMRMFYALKPTTTASGMDEAIFNELEEAILHGALQHLLVLPSVPWADRELASYHAKQYLREAAMRRANANLGNMRATVRVRMPGFA